MQKGMPKAKGDRGHEKMQSSRPRPRRYGCHRIVVTVKVFIGGDDVMMIKVTSEVRG